MKSKEYLYLQFVLTILFEINYAVEYLNYCTILQLDPLLRTNN